MTILSGDSDQGDNDHNSVESNGSPSLSRLELEAQYVDPHGDVFEFVLIAAQRRNGHYSLAQRDDAAKFLADGQHLLLRLSGATRLFPHLRGASIAFAPCFLTEQHDERFVFTLANGTRIHLSVRAAVGAYELGFYVGRLRAAQIDYANGASNTITDVERLAFFGGSRTKGELALPSLAVRTTKHGGNCGYLFDATHWDSPTSVDGYVVHTLACDGRLGDEIAHTSAHYSERFVLP